MESAPTRSIFLNLAVADLTASIAFFAALGFTFDERFTDEQATCMIVNDRAFVMLLVRDRFQDFTTREVCDSTAHTEAIMAITAADRAEVDALADLALASGGSPANAPIEHDVMYGRSFFDPDGHLWEVFWMDPAALDG